MLIDKFQSTHPLRGATKPPPVTLSPISISIHAPLAGCDDKPNEDPKGRSNFNPRTPCGVRRQISVRDFGVVYISIHAPLAGCDKLADSIVNDMKTTFQSTHPLRGATYPLRPRLRRKIISIHAPLAGCDLLGFSWLVGKPIISIHAPLAGCDAIFGAKQTTVSKFQSTHPLRGATRLF